MPTPAVVYSRTSHYKQSFIAMHKVLAGIMAAGDSAASRVTVYTVDGNQTTDIDTQIGSEWASTSGNT